MDRDDVGDAADDAEECGTEEGGEVRAGESRTQSAHSTVLFSSRLNALPGIVKAVVAASTLAFASLVLAAQPPSLELSSDTIILGIIGPGEPAVAEFAIANRGDASLQLALSDASVGFAAGV